MAPGSSGAALLDARGNAIGHVSEIRPLGNGMPAPGMPGALTAAAVEARLEAGDAELARAATLRDLDARTVMMVLHVAVPARGVQFLARMKPAGANAAAAPPAAK